jgi:hypothetical protein
MLSTRAIASPLLDISFVFNEAACKESSDKLVGLYSLSMLQERTHYSKTAFGLCRNLLRITSTNMSFEEVRRRQCGWHINPVQLKASISN